MRGRLGSGDVVARAGLEFGRGGGLADEGEKELSGFGVCLPLSILEEDFAVDLEVEAPLRLLSLFLDKCPGVWLLFGRLCCGGSVSSGISGGLVSDGES